MSDSAGTATAERGSAALCALLARAAAGARALAEYHAAHGRHGDLRPGALAVAADGSVAIVAPDPHRSGDIVQLLRYASPATAGRLPSDDPRDDLYSLGVMIYEELAGAPPFDAVDALGLVHQHMAVPAPPLGAARPDLPSVLVRIVHRLLEKAPNRRYASAAGLAADLTRCATEIRRGEVSDFELGTADRGAQFAFPERLYGRRAQLALLLDIVEDGLAGEGRVCLITGDAGTGKTALARVARAHAVAHGALFTEGKCDQNRGAFPYAAFTSTAAMMLEQTLSRTAPEIARWRAELLDALDDLAPVAAELIPELHLVIGQQPAPPPLAGVAGKIRLHTAVERLVRGLATPEHPLVVFTDDLQWADPASLELIGHLSTRGGLRNIALLGAFRHDEIAGDHPLARLAPTFAGMPRVVHEIRLAPLEVADVEALIADTWAPIEHPADLAAVVARKTGGNPFYVRQFLQLLADRSHLGYDPAAERWTWDPVGTHDLAVSDNVVDVMADRVRGYAAPARDALRVAAAIGSQFQLGTVADVLGVGEVEALLMLAPALHDEVLRPLGPTSMRVLQFAHDRVLQAAYDGLDELLLAGLHLQIADRLAATDVAREYVFEVADQFNLARLALEGPALRLEVAALNLQAGRAAQQALAHTAAARYFEAGIALLPGDAWETQYRLTFQLHQGAVEADSLLGRDTAFEPRIAELRDHAAPGADRVRVLTCQAAHYLHGGRPEDAVEVVTAALNAATRLTGPWLPDDPEAALTEALDGFTTRLAGRPAGDVIGGLPPTTDADTIAAFELVAALADALSVADIRLLHLLATQCTNLAIERGGHPTLGPLLACVGEALVAARRTTPDPDQTALAGLELAAGHPIIAVQAEVVYLRFAYAWTGPMRQLVERTEATHSAALAAHEPEWAAYAQNLRIMAEFCLGRSMSEVWQARERLDPHTRNYTTGVLLDVTRPLAEAAKAIAGHTTGLTEFDPSFDVAAHTRAGTRLPILRIPLLTAQAMLHALDERYTDVLTLLGDPQFSRTRVLFTLLPALLWRGVAHAGLADAAGDDAERATQLGGLDEVITTLERVADYGGRANVEHRIAFLVAERERLTGGDPDAHYRLAIGRALHGEYILEYGLIIERYGRWLHASEAPDTRVRMVWELALGAYRACEAHALVVRLERTLSAWSAQTPVPLGGGPGRFDPIDTQAILSAVQTIASERDLDTLLDRLLTLMIASTGADRGAIVRRVDDDLVVEARSNVAGAEELPLGLIRFVLNSGQTTQAHQLDDSEHTDAIGRFGPADAIAAGDVAAVLCLPIGRRAPYRRAIYLAHGSVPEAFAREGQRRILDWLAQQAAISVDNAETYDELEQLVNARTRELRDANELLRRHQVDLRRAKEGAEAATRAKSDFLANMSHEVRTPMNAILGLTELIRRDEHDPDQRDRLAKLEMSAEILMSVLDDVLDYSKVEAGKLELEHTAFEPRTLLDEAVELARVAAAQKGLDVSLMVTGHVPAQLVGDPLRLGQVLRNLLSNAVKFTASGRVEVHAGFAPVPDVAGSVDVTIVVGDSGVGMTPGEMARLFQPFSQADASTSRRFGGTGLGLAITSRLVGLMGGLISVDSAPGDGSEFTVRVRLPITEAPAPRAPARAPADAELAGVRVLLVEDNDLNRDVASAMLDRLGAQVTSTADGRAAIQAVRTAPFDIVLMDCQMPVLDGYAATSRIRALPGFADLPIVAMTANAMAGDRDRALDAGMNGHLAKPVSSAQLIQMVRAWMQPPASTAGLLGAAACFYGFDVAGAVERVPDAASLAGLVRRFVDANADVAARLAGAVEAGDADAVHHIAHALVGTAGMLGLTAVEAAGRSVTGAAPADLAGAIAQLGVEFTRTVRTLGLLWRR